MNTLKALRAKKASCLVHLKFNMLAQIDTDYLSARLLELIWTAESNSTTWEARFGQLPESDLNMIAQITGVSRDSGNFCEEAFSDGYDMLLNFAKESIDHWQSEEKLLPYEMKLVQYLQSLPQGTELELLNWEDYTNSPLTAKIYDFARDRYQRSFELVVEILHFEMRIIAY